MGKSLKDVFITVVLKSQSEWSGYQAAVGVELDLCILKHCMTRAPPVLAN